MRHWVGVSGMKHDTYMCVYVYIYVYINLSIIYIYIIYKIISALESGTFSSNPDLATYLARQPGHVVMPSLSFKFICIRVLFNTSCSVTERTIISSFE